MRGAAQQRAQTPQKEENGNATRTTPNIQPSSISISINDNRIFSLSLRLQNDNYSGGRGALFCVFKLSTGKEGHSTNLHMQMASLQEQHKKNSTS